MSLIWRLYVLVALAVIPAIAIQGWNELSLRRERETQAHAEAQRLAQFVTGELSQIVEGASLLLTTIASAPSVRKHDRPACTELVEGLLKASPQIAALGLVDSQGQWVCGAADPAAERAPLNRQAWFKDALERDGFRVVGFQREIVGDVPVLLFAQPVRVAQGAPGELLLLALDLAWLGDHFARRELPEGGSVGIADRDGVLLVRLPGPLAPGDPVLQRWLLDAPGPGTLAGVGPDGIERIVGYVPPAAAPAGGFVVSVGLARDPLMAPVDAATRRGLILIATGLVLALVAAWAGGRFFILRPVKLLASAAARWQQGDLTSRAQLPSRTDELGRLAAVMNEMAGAIQVRESALRESEAQLMLDVQQRQAAEEQRARALAETARERRLFKALVENLTEAIVAVFPQEGIILRNPAWLPLHGFTSFDELPGASVESFGHLFEVRDSEGRVMGPGSWVIRRVLAGESFKDLEVLLRRTDIDHERWISYNGAAVKDELGRVVLAILTIRDTTERKRFEASLRERDEMLSLAEEAARIGAWEVDVAAGTVRGTPAFFRLHGLEPSAEPLPHLLVRGRRHPKDQKRVVVEFDATVARGAARFETEYRVAHGEGWRWILGRGRVVRDELGRPARYAGIDMDITERKEAEERQNLLVRELDHRVKNLLAVIQSLVQQSGHAATSVRALQEALIGRLRAMAVAHELLSATRWGGAGLSALVDRTLRPHMADPDRLRLMVGDVVLDPSAAQNLALALHELATNAAKYGAWSSANGRVTVTAAAESGELALTWEESGGPEVSPPTHRGFGSLLLTRALSYQAAGRVELEWRRSGLVCCIRLRLRRVDVADEASR
jgi:PAS domain S-box-containing protein